MDVFYEKYKDALQGEISYLRKNGGKKQSLFDGKLIEFKKGKYIYSFESDDELSYPEGTPITIWHRQEKEEGLIVRFFGTALKGALRLNSGGSILCWNS